MTYYAICRATGLVIATGSTYREVSDAAAKASGWDMAPGTVAPYYLTTWAPEVA